MTTEPNPLILQAEGAPSPVRILVVGLGGLGCAVLWALAVRAARNPHWTWVLLDDDPVDESNLGRQLLYTEADLGRPKTEAARERLLELGVSLQALEIHSTRLVPENARDLVRGATLVLEGADNYATKFLAADACCLEGVPIVHGAAIGWRATALAVSKEGSPCYRCLFEDVPSGTHQSCESGGVMGPVVGFGGALMAELALNVLDGVPCFGSIYNYDGLRDHLRRVAVAARADCPLCGEPYGQPDRIFSIEEQRYTRPVCAA